MFQINPTAEATIHFHILETCWLKNDFATLLVNVFFSVILLNILLKKPQVEFLCVCVWFQVLITNAENKDGGGGAVGFVNIKDLMFPRDLSEIERRATESAQHQFVIRVRRFTITSQENSLHPSSHFCVNYAQMEAGPLMLIKIPRALFAFRKTPDIYYEVLCLPYLLASIHFIICYYAALLWVLACCSRPNSDYNL